MSQTPTVDILAYQRFLESTEITNIRLESLDVKRLGDPGPDGILTVDYGPEDHSFADGTLSVVFRTHITADSRAQDSEDRHVIADADIRYLVTYACTGEAPVPPMVDLFVTKNVIVNVWPYVRELVQSLSYRLDIPRIILELQVWPTPADIDDSSR